MARTRFRKNPSGWNAMVKGPKTERAMVRIAEEIVKKTEANGGRFTKNFEAKGNGDGTATAGTDWPFAHWDEWGTIYRQPRAPMRRAIAQLGLGRGFKEKGK